MSTSLVLKEVSPSGRATEATYTNYLKRCAHKDLVLKILINRKAKQKHVCLLSEPH
jgi:hypothetical protein